MRANPRRQGGPTWLAWWLTWAFLLFWPLALGWWPLEIGWLAVLAVTAFLAVTGARQARSRGPRARP
jgi:hypothetical protein